MILPSADDGTLLPQRVSLVAQAVRILKENINAGLWTDFLPGEHELCGHLHVSRVTLRKALDELQREGWVRSSQGKRRQITPLHRPPPASSRRVMLLTDQPLHLLHPFSIYWMDCLREHLSEAGYYLEIHPSQAPYGSNPERPLAQLQNQFNPAGWVLYHSTEPMQNWFSRQALPCVIAGSRHPNVRLSSVDVDYRAVCRHAVGQFLTRRHRRIVLLNPESGAAGDLEGEQGFLEEAQAARHADVQATVIRHDGTVASICNKLDLLLRRPNRPTAFLVSRPAYALTAASHLLRSKLDLPREAALISRDHDSFLESFVPTIACYFFNPTTFAHKVSRVVLQTVNGARACADVRLMPSFVAGQTLG